MRLLKRFKALGAWAKLERPEHILIDGRECAGAWAPDTLTMEIRKDLEPDAAELVWFHEVFHIADSCGWLTEDQNHIMARHVYSILKDNGLLKD